MQSLSTRAFVLLTSAPVLGSSNFLLLPSPLMLQPPQPLSSLTRLQNPSSFLTLALYLSCVMSLAVKFYCFILQRLKVKILRIYRYFISCYTKLNSLTLITPKQGKTQIWGVPATPYNFENLQKNTCIMMEV